MATAQVGTRWVKKVLLARLGLADVLKNKPKCLLPSPQMQERHWLLSSEAPIAPSRKRAPNPPGVSKSNGRRLFPP